MSQSTHSQDSNLDPHSAAKARRLAFLLTQSVMPQEQKEAWMNILPIMLPAQVDTLLEMLEREHKGYQASSADFLADLQRFQVELKERIAELKQEEQRVIQAFIEQEIKKLED